MPEPSIRHGGGITEAAAAYGGRPSDWLDLSTGINPVPVGLPNLPVSVWARLPDRDLYRVAREAAREFYGTASGVLPLPVPGTQAAIQRLPVFTERDARVAIVEPTYGEYALVFRRAGMGVDLISSLSEVDETHRTVVVVNPNNPDGRVVAREELLGLADRMAAGGGFLVVDEAFADADPAESVVGDGGREGLVVFRSFGKFFGLAGLRLGFVTAPAGITERMARGLGPWAVSGPALAIAAAVMRDAATIDGIRASIAERSAAMQRVLERAGLTIRGGTSLFFLIEHERAGDLYDALCRKHILVRPFDYAPDWLRIGLSPDAASDKRLGEALAGSLPIVSDMRVA